MSEDPIETATMLKGSQASTDAFKGFVPSEQMALKWSDNDQGLPWTTLSRWCLLVGFKTVRPTLKRSGPLQSHPMALKWSRFQIGPQHICYIWILLHLVFHTILHWSPSADNIHKIYIKGCKQVMKKLVYKDRVIRTATKRTETSRWHATQFYYIPNSLSAVTQQSEQRM